MAVKKTFDYKLGDAVKLVLSGEKGTVLGRAHYVDRNPVYYIRYLAADGRQGEDWWNESAIEAA